MSIENKFFNLFNIYYFLLPLNNFATEFNQVVNLFFKGAAVFATPSGSTKVLFKKISSLVFVTFSLQPNFPNDGTLIFLSY